VSWKFKVVPLTYTTDRDAWTLTLNNAGTLESLLSEGVLPTTELFCFFK
jgi:hypothetical protein